MWNLVRFKPFSSREDFIFNGAIVDADTGAFINLSGTTGSGTSSSWTVRAGNVITTSTTTITIPSLPIGNQLSTLSLTVPAGLAIVARNPVTIVDGGNNPMPGHCTNYCSPTGLPHCQIVVAF